VCVCVCVTDRHASFVRKCRTFSSVFSCSLSNITHPPGAPPAAAAAAAAFARDVIRMQLLSCCLLPKLNISIDLPIRYSRIRCK